MGHLTAAHGVAMLIFIALLVCSGEGKHKRQSFGELDDNKLSRAFYGRVRDMLEHDLMQSDEPIATGPVDVIQ